MPEAGVWRPVAPKAAFPRRREKKIAARPSVSSAGRIGRSLHKRRLTMLTLKNSVAVLAVAAGLTLCLAPHVALADDAPPGSSMGGFASPDSPVGEMEKHLDDIKKAEAKLNPPKN